MYPPFISISVFAPFFIVRATYRWRGDSAVLKKLLQVQFLHPQSGCSQDFFKLICQKLTKGDFGQIIFAKSKICKELWPILVMGVIKYVPLLVKLIHATCSQSCKFKKIVSHSEWKSFCRIFDTFFLYHLRFLHFCDKERCENQNFEKFF